MNDQLLDILCCPVTHRGLKRLGADQLGRLNAAIDGGGVVNAAGDPVSDRLEQALVTDDGRIAYPMRDGIPILLEDESIDCATLGV